ncbi:MAG: hypothetical protein U5K38_03235 [Woeseiaceae bacterium]|nr:hypothetical protein [Woeseiaceae bacterium]
MRRMTQTLTLALIVMVAAPLFAQQHQSGDRPMAQQMEKMHSHMQAMQEQMKEIKATKDPEKRKELMQEHRQSMHESRDGDGQHGKGPDVEGRNAAKAASDELCGGRCAMRAHAIDAESSGRHAATHANDADDDAGDGTSVCSGRAAVTRASAPLWCAPSSAITGELVYE